MRLVGAVLLVLVLWGGGAHAQTRLTAVLEPGAPGEQVSLTGTVSSDCAPGTPEVGLAPADASWVGKTGDPRTGNEIVLLRPAEAGSSFSAQVTLPDPQGASAMNMYAICRHAAAVEGGWFWIVKRYEFDSGSGAAAGSGAAGSGGAPLALAGVGAGVLAVAAGAVMLVRRGRRARTGGHERCEARHAAARAAVQVATMSEAARAGTALEEAGSAARDAREGFDVLLDESAVVGAAIDDVVRGAPG